MAFTQHVHILMGSAGRCSWETNPAVSSGAEGHWEALPASGLLLVDLLREPVFSAGVYAVGYVHIKHLAASWVQTKEHRPLVMPPCAGDCVDAERPEFIGFVHSSGLPVSIAQQSLGTLHRLALLCPIFRLLFSGSNFC